MIKNRTHEARIKALEEKNEKLVAQTLAVANTNAALLRHMGIRGKRIADGDWPGTGVFEYVVPAKPWWKFWR